MSKNMDALKQEIAELTTKLQTLADEFRSFKELMVATEVAKAKNPKAEKAEKAEKPKKEKAEKVKTNCPKISKKLTEELEKILGALYPEEKKERDAMNKKFRDFANAIPEEEYKTMELSVIVTNFMASIDKPNAEEEFSGGGALKVLSLTDLIDVQDEVSKTSTVGVYLLDGAQVTGPLRDEEKEDLETKTFKGKEYEVDAASGRVYDTETEEFLGYSRIKGKKFDGLIGDK